MRSGRLKHRITIKIPYSKMDEWESDNTSWAIYAVVWAEIKPLRARERHDDETYKMHVTHLIRMRFIRGVTPKMQIYFEGRKFNIQGITSQYEENRELVLEAEEIVEDQA